MTLRTRMMVATTGAVLLALLLPTLVVLSQLRGNLVNSLDRGLEQRAASVVAHLGARAGSDGDNDQSAVSGEPELGETGAYIQVVDARGRVGRPEPGSVALPVTPAVDAVIAGTRTSAYEDVVVAGTPLRMYTRPAPGGRAVQVARPLSEVDATLEAVRHLLYVVLGVGVLLAGLFGWLAAAAALSPVRRLSRAADEVARTRNLSVRIDATDADEVGRLATSINAMLASLERSVDAQKQLVADASHELRTPLTSLRTNVEVLADAERLEPQDRERLVRDVVAQLDELADLVTDLVELARGDTAGPGEVHDVRLDQLVASAVERAGRHYPTVTFETRLEPTISSVVAPSIDRAVANLLDNAAKWSPPGGTIEVALADGVLEVRDHGPGIPEEDLPHVFDRFYRARSARSTPGSGLGLAIVRQAAEANGGTVQAFSAAGGGSLVRLTLPASEESLATVGRR